MGRRILWFHSPISFLTPRQNLPTKSDFAWLALFLVTYVYQHMVFEYVINFLYAVRFLLLCCWGMDLNDDYVDRLSEKSDWYYLVRFFIKAITACTSSCLSIRATLCFSEFVISGVKHFVKTLNSLIPSAAVFKCSIYYFIVLSYLDLYVSCSVFCL